MIEATQFVEAVKDYFAFLEEELEFKLSRKKIFGNAYYDVQFDSKTRIVSVSYENVEDYLQVIIFILENGELPYYDDKTKTLHLNHLNTAILSKIDQIEFRLNTEIFLKFKSPNELCTRLLKSAQELRLCLKHLGA